MVHITKRKVQSTDFSSSHMCWFNQKSRASFLRSRRTFLSWRRGSSSERGGRWTATVSPPVPSFSISTAAAAMVAVVGAAASLQTAGQQWRLWVLGELGLVTTTNKPVGLIRLVLPKWRSPWAFRANWQPATRRWNVVHYVNIAWNYFYEYLSSNPTAEQLQLTRHSFFFKCSE